MPSVPLSGLLHQPDVSAFLCGVAARGRPGNAYLFFGPAGVGKCTAALAFARALLCERNAGPATAPSLFDAGGGAAAPRADGAPAGDACGACAACRKSATLEHPDLRFLFPVSGDEKDVEKSIPETFQKWRDDPFFVFAYDRAASIRLRMTRDLLHELAYKPFEAGWRVVVVRDADAMRQDQYSAMLKAIEEPGAVTVWILTTSRPNRLPPTIRSRCQRVRFAPLGEGAIESFLCERVGCGEKEARMLAALSSGSLARALTLRGLDPPEKGVAKPPTIQLRNQALALLATARDRDADVLWKEVQATCRSGRAGRDTLRLLIEFQALWLRDLLRARYGAARTQLVNRDLAAEVAGQAGTVDPTEIRRRLMVLEEALRAIEGNVSPDLALFSALSRVARPGRAAVVWPAHPTARWDY